MVGSTHRRTPACAPSPSRAALRRLPQPRSQEEGSRRPRPHPDSDHLERFASDSPYIDPGAEFYDRHNDPGRETQYLIAKLEALGHTATIEPATA